jgi:flagellar motor protein MotB
MANDNPQPVDDVLAFQARLGSKGPRATKVALGLVSLLAVIFVVGWYWPLHRAHAALRAEYAKASDTSRELRSKLEQTIKVLESTTRDRDALQQAQEGREAAEQERARVIDSLFDEVGKELEKFINAKMLTVEKTGSTLTVTLQNQRLQKTQDIDLTRDGKKVVCKAVAALKTPKAVHVRLEGLGTDDQAASRALEAYESGLEVGVARGARAAASALKCGVPEDKLMVTGGTPPKGSDKQTLRVVFEADAAEPISSGAGKSADTGDD